MAPELDVCWVCFREEMDWSVGYMMELGWLEWRSRKLCFGIGLARGS